MSQNPHLPDDLLLRCIFSRLPGKLAHRLKTLNKPYRKLLSSEVFRKECFARFPQSTILTCGRTDYNNDHSFDHTLSLLSEEERKTTSIGSPFHLGDDSEVIGCSGGLICSAFVHGCIFLWNPALDVYKDLQPPPGLFGPSGLVSLGFGCYEHEEADVFRVVFRVVRVVSSVAEVKSVAAVYSSESDSWVEIQDVPLFTSLHTGSDAIVNGNPYWVSLIEGFGVGLVRFDVRLMKFMTLPLPDQNEEFVLMDYEGRLGALVCTKNEGKKWSLDIWGFDDRSWSKKRRIGPIELGVERFLHCLKNGKILVGECSADDDRLHFVKEEEVVLFNTEKKGGGGEKFVIGGATLSKSYEFTPSLATIKGMRKAVYVSSSGLGPSWSWW